MDENGRETDREYGEGTKCKGKERRYWGEGDIKGKIDFVDLRM